MTMLLSLVEGGDFISDVKSVSLLDFTNGLSLGAWNQAPCGDGPVTEIITVDAKETSLNIVAQKLIALEDYFHLAQLAKRSSAKYVIWLRAQTTDEGYPRQSVVYGGGYSEPLAFYNPPASPGSLVEDIKIGIDRAPWWEDTASAGVNLTAQNACGGVSGTFSIMGSLPARIGYVSLVGLSSAALTEFWGGFLTDRERVIENFVSPWDVESGTAGTDTAAGGEGLQCTFTTTPTKATRLTLTPYQISNSNFADQRGTFNILLRAKCASGVTARVYLGCGMGSSIWYNNPAIITGTTAKLYPVGQITIPAGGRGSSYYDAIRATTLTLQAELVSGSAGAGALDMDCFIPMPADYFFHIGGGSGNNKLALLTHPLGMVTGYTYSGSNINGLADIAGTEARTFVVPYGNARFILAGQRVDGSTESDAADIVLKAFERYQTLLYTPPAE